MAPEEVIKLQTSTIERIIKLYPFIVLSLVIIFFISHFLYSVFNPVFIGSVKKIYLRPGLKGEEIAYLLTKEEIIRSPFYFRLLVSLRGSKLKAGYYEFHGFYNLLDVIKILEKGGQGLRITITEGMTAKEIEDLFAQKGLNFKPTKFKLGEADSELLTKYFSPTSSLEGFLAPDTYEFYKEDDEKTILKKILQNFTKKFLPEIIKSESLSPQEVLILASIVEKEAKNKEDFPIIAGILIKRYKNKMRLEADATLVYEKCGFRFCKEELTKKDLASDTPYNTYKIQGLPPTPISNPGILAIKAVVNPIETDYWFYIVTPDGKAYYAKTYSEHQQNIKKYLKK